MCGSECDVSEPIVVEWRKARKEHRCYACRETIRTGDRYHFTAQKDDAFATYKHCARCWMMGGAILEAGADSWQYDLRCGVSWREAFDEEPPENIARLAFMTPDEAQKAISGEGE